MQHVDDAPIIGELLYPEKLVGIPLFEQDIQSNHFDRDFYHTYGIGYYSKTMLLAVGGDIISPQKITIGKI